VGGVVVVALLRDRPDWAFAIAVAAMTLGSPVVNINSYSMLLACLAPWVWPVREPSGSPAVTEPPGRPEPRPRPLTV
jgi:hypothetical protein